MLEKILKFFGLTTLKRFETMKDAKNYYQSAKQDWVDKYRVLENKYNILFDWSLDKPELDFKEYENKVGRKKEGFGFDNELFAEWYDLHRRDQYMAFKVRVLCEHPHLLKSFIIAFSNFDWVSAQEYMEKTDWRWTSGGKDRVPSIDEIKMHIFTLINTESLNEKGGVSSGGYTLSLYNDKECGATCEISFKDKQSYSDNFSIQSVFNEKNKELIIK